MAPLRHEHVEERALERLRRHRAVDERGDRRAARALRIPEHGIEQRAAGVGVDLDEPRPVGVEMEVVAHENAVRARIMARNLGRVAKSRVPIARQRDGLLHGPYDFGHGVDVRT